MKVTIKDIARECGVSVATVSLALSGKSNRISQATRQKVIAVAEKYKYTPNNAAVSLVKQKSRMITMVSNDLTNPHISAIVMAVSRVLEKNNCGMISRFLESFYEAAAVKLWLSENPSRILKGYPVLDLRKI